MSQAFARLGSCVSLFEMAEHILPREDPDAAEIVQKSMEADGIDVVGKSARTANPGNHHDIFFYPSTQ